MKSVHDEATTDNRRLRIVRARTILSGNSASSDRLVNSEAEAALQRVFELCRQIRLQNETRADLERKKSRLIAVLAHASEACVRAQSAVRGEELDVALDVASSALVKLRVAVDAVRRDYEAQTTP